MILNLGCGNDKYGDVRIDVYETDATTHVADIEKGIPFDDNTFDEVYCKCIFEHLKNPNLMLKEINRVLKPGGKLDLTTDNAGYWKFYSFMGTHTGRYGSELDRHYAVYTFEHMKNHMVASGFKISDIKYEDMERPNWKSKLSYMTDIVFWAIPFLKNSAFPRIRVYAIKEESKSD